MRCKTKYKHVNIRGRPTVRKHTLIAERILGRKLRNRELVHHVDYDRSNNSTDNLVICPNDSYHMLIHRRTDAYEATGDANKIKCQYCSQWDDPEQITIAGKNGYHRYHKSCKAKYLREYRRRKSVSL